MKKIIFENDRGEKLEVLLSDKPGVIDRIFDVLYPNKGIQSQSKGYIALVNHMFAEIAELKNR